MISRENGIDLDQDEIDYDHINEIRFADDQSLIHENELQLHTTSLRLACERHNMKISTTKTEVMKISRTSSKLNIQVNNTLIKQVQEFKYLGSIFTEDGRPESEIETRCQRVNAVTYQLSPLLKHPNIDLQLKQQLINCIFLLTLCMLPMPNMVPNKSTGEKNLFV